MAKQEALVWGIEGDDLPEIITLKSGGKLDPREDYWSFIDGVQAVYLDFKRLPSQLKPLKNNLKRVLINVLENNSPAYAKNLFYNFQKISEVVAEGCEGPVSEIQEKDVVNFIAKYSKGDKLGMESQLSALIARWKKLDLNGISDEAADLIKNRRKKGNVKGEAVRTLDPVNGPLTDYELQLFISALTNAYAAGKISEQLFCLAWLVVLTGQRPCQYASLKVLDVVQQQTKDGDLRYEINIPKAKQREELGRESFLLKPLPYQFGVALWGYAHKVKHRHPERGEEAPLFPSGSRRIDDMQLNSKFLGHWDSLSLSVYFRNALAKIAPISPRTHEPMHLVIGRFRDTIGTRAAQEGYGELVIAEILGHSDTQNVDAYIAVIPEIAQRLDKKLAKDLAPIANAFSGKVLRNPEDATRAGDPTSQIIDYKFIKAGVGSCGTKYDCQFNAPIACYTCHNFEAWIDAPHEKLLDHLLSERERLLKKSGPRIAFDYDKTIVAIQAVIDECERIKSEKAGLNA